MTQSLYRLDSQFDRDLVDQELSALLEPRSGDKPLTVILAPSGNSALAAGETFELRVTLTNQGNQGAVIEVFIDETSPLRQWCTAPYERLALAAHQSSEVMFSFQVPIQTMPGSYSYLLVIDAPDHYPEATPIHHQAQLQVLPPIQSATRLNDPTFSLTPVTTPDQPIALQIDQLLEFRVRVHNRSNRVDRFRLACPDLPESWYTVHYPEGLQELGLVVAEQGLDLNPGAESVILLLLRLPAGVPAGQRFPTVRLYSANNPELVLLEMLYLQVLPLYGIDLELRTILGRVRQLPGLYEVRLTNQGNATREFDLLLHADREDDLCTYKLASPNVRLAPAETMRTQIQVKPTKWWRQPFRGTGMPISFQLELQDPHQLPLPVDRVEGTLIWEPRPWWQFWLAIAVGVGTVGAIAFAIWWLFFKPPAPPRILEVGSEASRYEQQHGDFITLNWQIENPRQIQTLTVSGDVTTVPTQQRVYDFRRGIPPELRSACTLEKLLVCRNVRTDAREPGDYTFKLVVASGRSVPPIFAITSKITIAPTPQPKLTGLEIAQVAVPESAAIAAQSKASNAIALTADQPIPLQILHLSWHLSHPEQLKSLKLNALLDNATLGESIDFAFDQGIPASLQPFCRSTPEAIICHNVPIAVTQPGTYQFELSLTAKSATAKSQPETPAEPQKTKSIQVQPPAPPRVAAFKTTKPSYQQARQEAVQLNWQVEHPRQLRELQLTGRSPNGTIQAPLRRYDFSRGVPPELQAYCKLADRLTCTNVPTNANAPGQYVFELAAIAQQGQVQPDTQQTDLIQIQPKPNNFQIRAFTLNGQPAPTRYQIEINSRQTPPSVQLGWQVTGSQVSVQLSPSPGNVASSGSIAYPVRRQSGEETLTLTATTATGQQLTRSVVIETIVIDKPNGSSGTPDLFNWAAGRSEKPTQP